MNRNHLSQDQLIDLMYGITPAEAHLDECPECHARYEALQARRALSAAPPASDAFYRQQRRAIMNRLAAPDRRAFSPARSVWVPAAVAALLVVGLAVSRPGRAPVRSTAPVETVAEIREASLDAADTGWFEDTYTEMQVSEPRALTPLRSLFVEGTVVQ